MAKPQTPEAIEAAAQAQEIKQLRKIGVIHREWDFTRLASERLYTAQRWMPWLQWVIRVSAVVAVLALVACLISVYRRPPALVLLTFPNGDLKCALPYIDPQTGQSFQRPADQEALCQRLAPPVAEEAPASAQAAPTAGAPTVTPEPNATATPGSASSPGASPAVAPTEGSR